MVWHFLHWNGKMRTHKMWLNFCYCITSKCSEWQHLKWHPKLHSHVHILEFLTNWMADLTSHSNFTLLSWWYFMTNLKCISRKWILNRKTHDGKLIITPIESKVFFFICEFSKCIESKSMIMKMILPIIRFHCLYMCSRVFAEHKHVEERFW